MIQWAWFSGALFIVWVLQSTIGAEFWPIVDLFVVLTVVWALSAPRHDARIAGFVAGLAQDLGSRDPLGLHAFTLGLTALFVTKLRDHIFRHTFFTRAVVAAIAVFPGQLLIPFHLRIVHGIAPDGIAAALLFAVLRTVFCALLAAAILELPALGGQRHSFVYPRRYD